ncbi:hypothetical protein EK904_015192 [Melospiza melodia maxima]|nr:hypothetical protein EK904_015192 [Melospiza melodia maxima]
MEYLFVFERDCFAFPVSHVCVSFRFYCNTCGHFSMLTSHILNVRYMEITHKLVCVSSFHAKSPRSTETFVWLIPDFQAQQCFWDCI